MKTKVTKSRDETILSGEETLRPGSKANNFQLGVQTIRSIVGESVSEEKIRYYLSGADGNIEIALNHVLNGIEKQKVVAASHETPSTLERVLSELAEEVKCSLCLSYFNQPVVLGCFHTFCLTCLDELVTPEQSIPCPLCRKSFKLDERGVRGLMYNHYLANIVEKLKAAQNTKMCASCDKSICSIFCKQCKAFLCMECSKNIHSMRLMQKHDCKPFEDCFFNSTVTPVASGLSTDVQWELDYVIPFNVKKEICVDIFYSWIKELWFAPSDLEKNALLREFKVVFMPYWQFEVEAVTHSQFSANGKNLGSNSSSSHHSRKKSQNHSHKTPSRRFDLLVCGSSAEDASFLGYLDPWKTEQIQPFTLKHAEGATVKPFTMDSETAWKKAGKEKLDRLNLESSDRKLRARTRADSLTYVSGATPVPIVTNGTMAGQYTTLSHSNKKARRVFVPVYVTSYEYQGRKYRFVINGSTARAYGQRPYSTGKLASLSFTGLGAAIGLFTSRVSGISV